MDTDTLRLFVGVMRQGSFSAAARERDLSPSAVSRAVATLEEELGVRLFNRTTRHITPTDAGRAYFQAIEPVVEGLEAASHAALDAGREPQGAIRIHAPAGFAQANIFPLLPAFVARWPDVTFEFLLNDEEVDLVAARIDVAIRLWPFQGQSNIARRLCPMNEVICASPAYLANAPPLQDPQDLALHRCVLFNLKGYRSTWRLRDRAGHVSAVEVRPRCVVTNALALQACTRLGLGPALVPRWIVGADLENGSLVRLFPDHAATATDFEDAAAWLLLPSRRYVPLKVRTFIDWLVVSFRDGPLGEGLGKQRHSGCKASGGK